MLISRSPSLVGILQLAYMADTDLVDVSLASLSIAKRTSLNSLDDLALYCVATHLDALELQYLSVTCKSLQLALQDACAQRWLEATEGASRLRAKPSMLSRASAQEQLDDYLLNGPGAVPRACVDWCNRNVRPVHIAVLLR